MIGGGYFGGNGFSGGLLACFRKISQSEGWRTFELTTRVEILKASGTRRVWARETGSGIRATATNSCDGARK